MDTLESMNTMPLQVNDFAKKYLLEAAKWAKFLSIVSMIMCFFVALFAIFILTFSSVVVSMAPEVPASAIMVMGVTMFVSLGLMIYPVLALYRFATKTSSAIMRNNEIEMQEAFRNQRNVFRYYGILMILTILLYVFSFIGIFI